MADLKLVNKIEVPTSHGLCEIHLNFGSVTKLSKEDKVDVLVVSAFPGDYSPTPTSVIGALQRDLGISVRSLSKDKEEDLRRLFSCWWSKPLSGDHSFNRILCFEGGFKRGSRPPMVVGEVFRSLVSLCKEQDIKVMMPLLAAGDQGYSQNMMLRLIVEAAIHWMQIGLPLKVLKIVIFARDLKKISKHPMLDYFNTLKEKWILKMEKEKEEPAAHAINYDVYLSFNTKDKSLADTVRKYLLEKSKEIRIYSDHQNINPEESWQEEIYQVMVTCARVITILSPRFLADEACLEQYNIALCCTRNMKRDYLAPFYVDSIEEMPTYMCLIQYVDCRPFDHDKISNACFVVTNWLQIHLAEIQQLDTGVKKALTQPKPLKKTHYDVFISYSHVNTDAAKRIHKHLSLFHPDWNIFIDISELQTGVAWQVKLYDSIESSGIVIALLSPTYVASKVCQEEYNLALAMHHDVAYETKLFPILVETVENLPAWCCGIPPVDCRNESEIGLMNILEKVNLFQRLDLLEQPKITAVDDVTSNWRSGHFLSDFACLPNINMKDVEALVLSNELQLPAKPSNIDVVLCYHKSNESSGKFLQERLKFYRPNMRISLPQESKVRHAIFDEADVVVPLLSSEFTKSAELSEELNTALCRQRVSDKLILFPIFLEYLPPSPAYFHLLWSVFSCTDTIWGKSKQRSSKSSYSAGERCLDIAARVIGFINSRPEFVKGSFKTLLSTEELKQSTLQLRGKKRVDSGSFNPLFIEEPKTVRLVKDPEHVPEASKPTQESSLADEANTELFIENKGDCLKATPEERNIPKAATENTDITAHESLKPPIAPTKPQADPTKPLTDTEKPPTAPTKSQADQMEPLADPTKPSADTTTLAEKPVRSPAIKHVDGKAPLQIAKSKAEANAESTTKKKRTTEANESSAEDPTEASESSAEDPTEASESSAEDQELK